MSDDTNATGSAAASSKEKDSTGTSGQQKGGEAAGSGTGWRSALPGLRLVGIAALAAGAVLVGARVEAPVTLAALGEPVAGRPSQPGPVVEPLSRAQLTCVGPEALGLADGTVEETPMSVTAAAAAAPRNLVPTPGSDGGGDDGSAGSLLLEGTPASTDADPEPVTGQAPDRAPVELTVSEAQGVQIAGDGAAAMGLAAVQWSVAETEFARGLTAAPCATPSTESWLLAGGGEAGRLERLVLLNPSSDAITVDVTVHGAQGVNPSTGGQDVVVPGQGRVVLLVDAIAEGEQSPALRVTSSGGPVVAALGDRWLDGSVDRGLELTPPAAPPEVSQVVPIVADGPVTDITAQVLRVVVPGEVEAIVQVRALTPDGPLRVENDVTRVAGGSAVDIDISDVPDGATAVQVTSDEPVTAAAMTEVRRPPEPQTGEDSDPEDTNPEDSTEPAEDAEETEDVDPDSAVGELAWIPASSPIRDLAGAPLPHDEQVTLRSDLVLSSLGGATVEVVTLDAEGEVSSEQVEVPAAGGIRVELGDARQVWIAPGSGTDEAGTGEAGTGEAGTDEAGTDEAGVVYAAVVVTAPQAAGGPMVAGVPLAELAVSRESLPVAPVLP